MIKQKIELTFVVCTSIVAVLFLPMSTWVWVVITQAATAVLFVGLSFYRKNDQPGRVINDDSLTTMLLSYATGDTIFITNKDGLITKTNSAVGIPNASVSIGQHIDDIFEFTDAKLTPSPLFAGGSYVGDAISIVDRQFTIANTVRAVVVKMIPFTSIDGVKDDRCMVLLHDVSHERTLEQQRSEFISITSHELRTPITIAASSLSLLLTVPGDIASQRSRVATAEEALNHLSEIVNELSMLSSAQDGMLDVDITNVDIAQILKQEVSNHAQIAKRKNIGLRADIDSRVRPVFTSERRVSEIIRIYLNNAFRYTEKGEVVLKAAYSDDGGVTIAVEDTGLGIPAASQVNIFTKFYQVEDAMARSSNGGGLGLGLYTVKELATRLNADVWFESKENVGSKFFLHVPPFSRQAKDTQQVLDASLRDVSQAL